MDSVFIKLTGIHITLVAAPAADEGKPAAALRVQHYSGVSSGITTEMNRYEKYDWPISVCECARN